jgi:prepilin-type N-terminal cleavage/methylation domain-containing protein
MTILPSRRAFTLVELLVVIGIIAVLIGILLPSLNRARQHAISLQCMGNLRQIGNASLMYAQDNKGQLPCGSWGGTIEKFAQWPNASDPFKTSSIKYAMAKYLGFKNPPTAAPYPAVRVFFGPVNDQRPWLPEDFLTYGTGQSDGKFTYWWVANPFDLTAVNTTYGGDPDKYAAAYFWDIDKDGQTRPGVEYLRTTKDKRPSEIAICVDQSKQQQALGGWYYMHGTSSGSRKGWKNELFGDGHADALKPGAMWDNTSTQVWGPGQVRPRWGLNNPAAW